MKNDKQTDSVASPSVKPRDLKWGCAFTATSNNTERLEVRRVENAVNYSLIVCTENYSVDWTNAVQTGKRLCEFPDSAEGLKNARLMVAAVNAYNPEREAALRDVAEAAKDVNALVWANKCDTAQFRNIATRLDDALAKLSTL